MMRRHFRHLAFFSAIVLALVTTLHGSGSALTGEDGQDQGGFKFKSGVELINVTATVTDRSGRFAGRLRKEDFAVYEDNKLVEVSQKREKKTLN